MPRKTVFMFLLLFAALAFRTASVAEPMTSYRPDYAKARVLNVESYEREEVNDVGYSSGFQVVRLKILSGKYKGQTVSTTQMLGSAMGVSMDDIKPGDKVVLFVDEYPAVEESPDGSPVFHIADYARETPLYALALLYALLLIGVGGLKGLKSLISLVITIAVLFLFLFPLTLWGYNPLLLSVIISAIISFIVFRIIGGHSIKSLAAATGTTIGVAIAGLLAAVFGSMVHLTGMSSEEARILLYSMNLNIDYRGLVFGSILIGALGAIMDVGMSIASSIDEVKRANPGADLRKLFDAGMNVGRDVMGTMSNTLILAYTGGALPLLLLFIANNASPLKILNLEMIAEEVIRALAGSVGLVLCIPVTAIVAAFMYTRKRS